MDLVGSRPVAMSSGSLFIHLVDDAGLFPPEELAMPDALARHRRDEAAHHPLLTGRFLCPAARCEELLRLLGPADRIRLGLISPLDRSVLHPALGLVTADPHVELAAVEGVGEPSALDLLPDGVPGYVELAIRGDWVASLKDVAAAGRAAKVRCGGQRAELFPTPEQLGGFVYECARLGVPFKATAGLHHAMPHRDPETGFPHHGFLTLLLAACRAVAGAERDDVVDILRCTDAGAAVAEARAIPTDRAQAARRLFHAYGSCSTREPIEDLHALGLVDAYRTLQL